MRKTLTGARFTMRADVLKPGDVVSDPLDVGYYGEWVENQDPLTGDIVRIWVPFTTNDPRSPNVDESITHGKIKCLARGIVDGGIRVAGNTERFGDSYQNMEYVKMWTPANTLLTKNDRVTNISNRDGHIMWIDEELQNTPSETPRSTVFNVNGVTPLFDAFNKVKEYFILLERAEV